MTSSVPNLSVFFNRVLPGLGLLFFLILIFTGEALAKTSPMAEMVNAEKHLLKEEFARAELSYKKAILYFSVKKDRYSEANAKNQLAKVLQILGKEEEAEVILLANEKAIQSNFPNSFLLAECYDILGELRYYVSDVERAASYFRTSYQLKKRLLPANDARLALSISNMGRYYNYKQNLDSAINYTKSAVKILENKAVNLDKINPEQVYCEYAYALKEAMYLKLGSSPQKISYHQYYQKYVRPVYFKALAVNSSGEGKREYWRAYIYHYLGNTYTDEIRKSEEFDEPAACKRNQRRYLQESVRYYQKAISIQKAILPENNPRLAMTYFVMALANDYSYSDPRISLALYQKSLAQLHPSMGNESFSSLPGDYNPYNLHLVLSLISFKIQSYYTLYNINRQESDAKEVLRHTDYLVSIWLELLKKYELNTSGDVSTFYYKIPFQYAIDICYRLDKAFPHSNYASISLRYFEWSKYSSFLKKAITGHKNREPLMAKMKGRLLDLKHIQSRMPRNLGVIEYFDSPNYFYSLYFTKNRTVLMRFPFTAAKQNRLKYRIANLGELNAVEYKSFALNLYQLFLGKIQVDPYIRKIHIIPGNMYSHVIPFGALLKDNKGEDFQDYSYLIKEHKITYSLSLMVDYVNDSYSKKCRINRDLFLAPANSHFSDLPFSNEFVRSKTSGTNTRVIYGQKAGAATLKKMKNYNVIHLATHSVANSEVSDSSYLVFSDRKVYLPELFKYKVNSNLVNLAACETTLGKSSDHNGNTMSFVRAFTYMGAQAITSTLWKVDDQMTAQIYSLFFKELERGDDKAGALQMAKLQYLKANIANAAHPYYWAGIVLYGNNDPIYPKPAIERAYQAFLSSLIVIVSGFLLS